MDGTQYNLHLGDEVPTIEVGRLSDETRTLTIYASRRRHSIVLFMTSDALEQTIKVIEEAYRVQR